MFFYQRQTERQTETETETDKERHGQRQPETQTDRQTDGQTDRQTDGETEIQRQRALGCLSVSFYRVAVTSMHSKLQLSRLKRFAHYLFNHFICNINTVKHRDVNTVKHGSPECFYL